MTYEKFNNKTDSLTKRNTVQYKVKRDSIYFGTSSANFDKECS